jgi:hypothetical protein
VIRSVVAVMLPEGEIKIPVVGERVRVIGQKDEFMVISVDRARHVAELMKMTGIRRVEEGVSLRVIRPVADQGTHRLRIGSEVVEPM